MLHVGWVCCAKRVFFFLNLDCNILFFIFRNGAWWLHAFLQSQQTALSSSGLFSTVALNPKGLPALPFRWIDDDDFPFSEQSSFWICNDNSHLPDCLNGRFHLEIVQQV